jgi:hypothetical protein
VQQQRLGVDGLLLLPPPPVATLLTLDSREEAAGPTQGLGASCCSTGGCAWIQGEGGNRLEGGGARVGGDAGDGGARMEAQ